MASNFLSIAAVVNRGSFENMLAENLTFTPGHQLRHVKFVNMVQGGLTSIPWRSQQEVTLPSKSIFHNNLEVTGLHMAMQELKKMWEPKISKLKGGCTSSAGLVLQSWLQDIHVPVEDRWFTQSKSSNWLRIYHQTCPGWGEVLDGHGGRRITIIQGPHRAPAECISIW